MQELDNNIYVPVIRVHTALYIAIQCGISLYSGTCWYAMLLLYMFLVSLTKLM